jgi:hypothetical protein
MTVTGLSGPFAFLDTSIRLKHSCVVCYLVYGNLKSIEKHSALV